MYIFAQESPTTTTIHTTTTTINTLTNALPHMSKGVAYLLLAAMAAIVLFVFFLFFFVFLPYKMGTAGLMPAYESGVCEHLGSWDRRRSINIGPYDQANPRNRKFIRRLFWRLPIINRITRVNLESDPIVIEKGNAVVEGLEVQYEATGMYQVIDAFDLLSSVNIKAFYAIVQSEEEKLSPADRRQHAIRQTALKIIKGALTGAISQPGVQYEELRSRDPAVMARLMEEVNAEIGPSGMWFTGLSFSDFGVTDTLARDVASRTRADLALQGMENYSFGMLRPDGLYDRMLQRVHELYPGLSEAEAHAKVELIIKTGTATVSSGGTGFVIPTD